jgi:hypothetical protein
MRHSGCPSPALERRLLCGGVKRAASAASGAWGARRLRVHRSAPRAPACTSMCAIRRRQLAAAHLSYSASQCWQIDRVDVRVLFAAAQAALSRVVAGHVPFNTGSGAAARDERLRLALQSGTPWRRENLRIFPAERCVSGRNGTPGERVYPKGTVGSNPTLSASPRGAGWTRTAGRANIGDATQRCDGQW